MGEERDMGVAPSGPGSQASPEAAGASSPSVSIPNAGARSLHALGLGYYYDAADWEVTCHASDLDHVSDWLGESQGYGRGVYEVATLIAGPTLFAGHYPIGWVEGSDPGDVDDWEVRFFQSREHWARAVTSAIEARRAETRSGSVADESAVGEAETPSTCSGNTGKAVAS